MIINTPRENIEKTDRPATAGDECLEVVMPQDLSLWSPEARQQLDEMLGWLNFSNGAPDARFERQVNALYRRFEVETPSDRRPWEALHDALTARLSELTGQTGQPAQQAFSDSTQAAAVLGVVFDDLLPAYRRFHADLLHHQRDEALFRPFFLARAFEAVLRLGPPWDETPRLVERAIDALNDFIGYRPIAVLRTPQKIEPYPHEWVCPLPLYLKGAGVEHGPYYDVVRTALEILANTDRGQLEQLWFDPELLDELALDPRAYDFDHPANKRPNHHFGQWDPHRLDNQGRHRRFVVQGVTLEAICTRLEEPAETSYEERLFEAGAVLAGTMLMASGVCGRGPDSHDSGTTLSKLMPRIAAARDGYYEQLLARVAGPHGVRLREESERLHQPFGGARQHLNQRLARLRAAQLEHVHLALLFARMGHAAASARQSEVVPVTSARLLCEISSRLAIGHQHIDRAQPTRTAELLHEVEGLLERGIQCGALVDPWNILGFQGNFSLFPAIENTVRDHRVDVFIHVLRQIFDLYVRACGEAAAAGHTELQDRLQQRLNRVARWWDKFASVEVSGLERLSGREAAESAEHVAAALGAWHAAGAAAGDIAFWRKHVARFQAPKSYALVVTALLDKSDFIAARALLMQWLGQIEQTPLVDGEFSFHELALRWLSDVAGDNQSAPPEEATTENLGLIRKFFDYLEANADEHWEVPRLEIGHTPRQGAATSDDESPPADDEEQGSRFGAAYEDVVYRDSTSDGVEGDTLEGGHAVGDFPLEGAATRLGEQLPLQVTFARLWKMAAVSPVVRRAPQESREMLLAWHRQTRINAAHLRLLLAEVSAQRLPAPLGTQESLVEYDRRRVMKENLLSRIIVTSIEMQSAARLTLAAVADGEDTAPLAERLTAWQQQAIMVLRGLLMGDTAEAREAMVRLQIALAAEPILYIPLAKNGAPESIVAAQGIQQLLEVLLRTLPRAGLLGEACQLIVMAQDMEQTRPAGEGVVTEFDRLFETGYVAIVESLVLSAQAHHMPDTELIDSLHELTEGLLQRWLTHSRSLRLSVLEKVSDKDRWQALQNFVQTYGNDIFTQRFMNLGNLRAILHQGADAYLKRLEDEGECEWKLLGALDREVPRNVAVEQLTIALEAVAENYAEYKDFNATTTQSDRGELLYVLLDFLRLKSSYERFAWTIRPILTAHEVLVRQQKTAAAELWRRAIVSRTGEVADWHLRRLEDLVRQYGLRLPTIAGRLQERFVRVLAVDRIRSLVAPAVDELRRGETPIACELLEQEIEEFTEHPTGAGLDVPPWLAALEQEAERVLDGSRLRAPIVEIPVLAPPPSWDDIVAQARSWDAK